MSTWHDDMMNDNEYPNVTVSAGTQRVHVDRLVMPFSHLALGARFRYRESDQVWIKIDGAGYGVIAEYDKENICSAHWHGQAICSALGKEDEKLMIIFVA